MVTRILLALVVLTGVASAQAPQKITIGIYAPSAPFDTAQARLTYVQSLAKAIEQATGIKTEAQSYATMAALKKGNPDYAIVEGQCYATNLGWQLLANAKIGDSTSRAWALFSSGSTTMQALKDKKLAFMATGCNDDGFIENAMLDSEVDDKFFGAKLPGTDLNGAVASVASYKTAQAVFAPVQLGTAKGLTKVFDTGSVPNPAFVEIAGSKLPGTITQKVAAAVIGYGGGGAISGWTKPSRDVYQSLAGRLAPVRKQGIFATPEPGRLDSKDVLSDPQTLRETAFVVVRHHFVHVGRIE
jgi:hypothetical protein